jgi:SagB-type dehydrogenase family enzyme
MDNWNTELALTFHEETKHSYESVYRNRHFLDWENQPQPFKRYLGLEAIPLPADLPVTQMPALLALSPPGETGVTTSVPTLHDLAYVLFYAAGVTKRRFYPGHGEMWFRAAACTGALYHIDLYLSVCDVPALHDGLYHFDPYDFALRQLRQGDYRRVLVEASGNDPALQGAPVILLGSDTFWRNAWKYRARAYRHSFWDAGTILANLLAAAHARTLPAHLTLGFADAPVNTLLDVDTDREVALFLVGLGTGAARSPRRRRRRGASLTAPLPPAAPSVTPLHLAVAPLSPEELDYPAMRIMHTASSLESPEDAAEWRGAAPETSFPSVTGELFSLYPNTVDALPSAALEDVIRHRGSTRRFSHQPLSLVQLSNVLVSATQPIPADCLAASGRRCNDLYLIVNAVAGLPSGAYVFHPQSQALELLCAGDFRRQAGELALGQELAADASVAVFCLCDILALLERFGNRGYRVAQLEGGILGGRMYLAAYAQGFGATGLTFFDDDVTAFFSPHAADKSVMFLIALGYAARR